MDDDARFIPVKPLFKEALERSFRSKLTRGWLMKGVPETVLQDVTLVDDPSDAEKPARSGRVLHEPGPALARAAFEESVSPSVRRKIFQGDGIAIVVTVPSAAWVRPI